MSLFGSTINSLQNGLDHAVIKNQAIANNIANVDTANYKAKEVVFKNILNQEMSSGFQAKRTHKDHLIFGSDQSSSRIVSSNNTQYNHNGNNVDIDKEMTELANNQIYYQALVDRMNGKLNSLQTVIRGGA